MIRRLLALAAIVSALTIALTSWIVIGRIELGATGSLDEVARSIEGVEAALEQTSRVVDASATALEGAASSLDTAGAAADATSDVADDVAAVTESLPPVVEGLGDGLTLLDQVIGDLDRVLSALPLGGSLAIGDVDAQGLAAATEPLVEDLERSGASLSELSERAAELGADSRSFAADLRIVSAELERSNERLAEVSADVARAVTVVDGLADDGQIDLIWVRVLIAALAGTVVLTNVANLVEAGGYRGDS